MVLSGFKGKVMQQAPPQAPGNDRLGSFDSEKGLYKWGRCGFQTSDPELAACLGLYQHIAFTKRVRARRCTLARFLFRFRGGGTHRALEYEFYFD